jgi:hypothetical protein
MPGAKSDLVESKQKILDSPIWDKKKIKFRPVQSIWNGNFQHIMWWGVNGWVIVNHHDQEILLVDPWPSYNEMDKAVGVRRLRAAANFLRRAVTESYKLVGVLLSHTHFDHADDIPRLFLALSLAPATVTYPGGLKAKYVGPALGLDDLPVICADYDTLHYLRGGFAQLKGPLWDHYKTTKNDKWKPITKPDGKWVHYDDHYNAAHQPPLRAGIKCKPFTLGSFSIQPYVWDHYSIMPFDKGIFGAAGDLQRQSAFLIKHARAKRAKRTFVSGSAGEMSKRYTISVKKQKPPIATDLLIQSICKQGKSFNDMLAYQQQCFTIKDMIVCSHFEDFFWGQGGVSGKPGFRKNWKEMVKPYIKRLRSKRLKKRVYLVGRTGFEYAMPSGPSAFQLGDSELKK